MDTLHSLIRALWAMFLFAQIDASHAESIREVIPKGETRIVHIRDWHLVSKDDFAADTELTGKDLDDAYAEHVKAVKAVQASQRKILKDVKEAYSEGLTKSDMPVFEAIVRVMRKKPDEERLMRMGAVAQMLVEEKLSVLPAEDESFEKANPVTDGKVDIDQDEQERREDAIVRNLLKKKSTVYLVLGGAHDLTDNIRKLSKDRGYTVVTPKGYPEAE